MPAGQQKLHVQEDIQAILMQKKYLDLMFFLTSKNKLKLKKEKIKL